MSLDNMAVGHVAQKSQIHLNKVLSTLNLLVTEDCTIPFISRYRKEATGGLDEVQVGAINQAYENYLEREKRRAYILETIKKQEMMTPELEKKILAADTLNKLEDLYAPYKSKRKSKGMVAREAGLEPLANLIRTTSKDIKSLLVEVGKDYINKEKNQIALTKKNNLGFLKNFYLPPMKEVKDGSLLRNWKHHSNFKNLISNKKLDINLYYKYTKKNPMQTEWFSLKNNYEFIPSFTKKIFKEVLKIN